MSVAPGDGLFWGGFATWIAPPICKSFSSFYFLDLSDTLPFSLSLCTSWLWLLILRKRYANIRISTWQFFKISALYWRYSNKVGNLIRKKKKPETNPKSSKNTEKNSRFASSNLRRRGRHLVGLSFCWCPVSQGPLSFLNQAPLEGNRKLTHINTWRCGKVSLSLRTWMCSDFISVCLFSFLPRASEAEPNSVESILTEILNDSSSGCGLTWAGTQPPEYPQGRTVSFFIC